ADLTERERQEVEEERALGLRREADHLALRFGVRALVDVLQVRRFSAEARPVVDQLAVDLARHVVDEAHRFGLRTCQRPQSLKRLSMSSSVISANGESAPGSATFFRSDSKM